MTAGVHAAAAGWIAPAWTAPPARAPRPAPLAASSDDALVAAAAAGSLTPSPVWWSATSRR